MSIATIPAALDALRSGRPIIVADDEGRENEGDVILAAQFATQQWIAWLVRHSSGFICAPMTDEIADRLELPLMVARNEDVRGTNYTVTVDAAEGVTTGISAGDRAHTLRVLADLDSTPAHLHRPGHILPLRAKPGGVRERNGHTEAAVDLLKLAGLTPVGVISEIVGDDGEMMRLPALIALGQAEDVPVITIADLIDHLREMHDDADVPVTVPIPETSRVIFEVETTVPTSHGSFRIRAYRDRMTGADHLAIIAGHLGEGSLLRVHSECLTGEVLGSLKCECGPQLDTALDLIDRDGGVVIYMRGHEGRGIGLVNKLRAYRLQDDGLDTLDANLALGLPADGRDYGAAVAILADLGLSQVQVITNNPDKLHQLRRRGITVLDQVPLVVGLGEFNERYLETKRDRMGHLLPDDAALAHSAAAGVEGRDRSVAAGATARSIQSAKEQEL